MEQPIIYIVLAVLGLCMGSFAGALVWRLRARQLKEDKESGEEVDKDELKRLMPLTKETMKTDRSRCLHCGHALHWYDLLPVVSWISTGGKCRYCRKFIGWFEPAIELSMALFFVGSYVFWPHEFLSYSDTFHFSLWLVAGVLLAVLFVYDFKWFLLPNRIMFPLVGIAGLAATVQVFDSSDIPMALLNIAGAVTIMSGIYLVLWLVSKGKWIGFGDVKLGLGLALLLANWHLAFIALFAANLIGSILVIIGMLSGKITRRTRVPFGPLLIVGGVIAMLFGDRILQWYFSAFL